MEVILYKLLQFIFTRSKKQSALLSYNFFKTKFVRNGTIRSCLLTFIPEIKAVHV